MKKSKKAGATYAVGYKKPPKAHQFKPGKSGNPKGRPKKKPSTEETFLREAARLVRVRSGDGIEKISKRDALARKVFQSALEGNLTAMRLLIALLTGGELRASEKEQERGQAEGEAADLVDDDAVRRMLARFSHLLDAAEDA